MAKLYTSTIGPKKKPKGHKPKGKKRPPVDPYAAQVEATIAPKYAPVEQELAGERRISDQMMANTGNWWQKYQADVAAANARTQQGYASAQQGVYNQANTARTQDAAQSAELDKSAQANAALRGTVTGPSPAAQAQAARQASGSSFGGLIGAQGAAQNAYGQQQYANAGGIRALELGKERQRRGLVDKKFQDLALQKGADRVSTRQQLSDAAWKTKLEEATFNLKREDTLGDNARQDFTARDTAADRKARRKQAAKNQRATGMRADRKYNLDLQKFGADTAKDNYQREHGLGPYKPAKGDSGGSGSGRVHKGYGRTNVSLPVAVTKRQTWRGLTALGLHEKYPKGTNPRLLKALGEYHRYHGKVTKKTALDIYRTFGFRIPYMKPGSGKRVRHSPNAPGAGGGARPT